MKNFRPVVFASVLALAGVFLVSAVASEKEKGEKENEKEKSEKKVVGSLRPEGKLKPADLPTYAQISFADALQRALVAAPGSVIKGELEVENGNLMYSFEIVGTDKKIREVEIDAGNGKVLDVDED